MRRLRYPNRPRSCHPRIPRIQALRQRKDHSKMLQRGKGSENASVVGESKRERSEERRM